MTEPARLDSDSQIPALERLNVFVGKWKSNGQQYDGPIGPSAKITAVETYEWLQGGHFLIHRFTGHVGSEEAACIEIMGHDTVTGCYPIHTYYNVGHKADWRARVNNGIWTITGGWQIGGKSRPVRCTIRFSESGNNMAGKWEHSPDGAKWQPFWEVSATKTK
jgi:hypothetical protein